MTDRLTLKHILRARDMFDSAPIPTTNRFVLQSWETEPMETTQTTVTEVTETKRTAEDIISSLREGTYFTKDGNYIISSDWGSNLAIHSNPKYRNKDVVLSESNLKELTSLFELINASSELDDAKWTVQYEVDQLNKKGK